MENPTVPAMSLKKTCIEKSTGRGWHRLLSTLQARDGPRDPAERPLETGALQSDGKVTWKMSDEVPASGSSPMSVDRPPRMTAGPISCMALVILLQRNARARVLGRNPTL